MARNLVVLMSLTCLLVLTGCQMGRDAQEGDLPAKASTRTPPSELEVVARLEVAPGNLTVLPDGQVVFSLHQHFEPVVRVGVLQPGNKIAPWPNAAMNGLEGRSAVVFDSVLGIQADVQGVVWMLDNGLRGGTTPKLVAWDSRAARLHRVIHLPQPVTVSDSFLNDLAVDLAAQSIYIADPAGGANAALIVVDLRTGVSRRVLAGDRSVVPEDIDMVIDRVAVEIRRPDGSRFRPRVGVNPIALDGGNTWLYFGPMHGRSVYRVRTEDLRNADLTDEQLASRVERYADKPLSDGSSVDVAGNVYITDVTANAVGVIGADRQYRILVQDERLLSWPDCFSYGPDGMLYVVSNQLHRGPILNAGQDMSKPPFYILRFKPLADGVVGR